MRSSAPSRRFRWNGWAWERRGTAYPSMSMTSCIGCARPLNQDFGKPAILSPSRATGLGALRPTVSLTFASVPRSRKDARKKTKRPTRRRFPPLLFADRACIGLMMTSARPGNWRHVKKAWSGAFSSFARKPDQAVAVRNFFVVSSSFARNQSSSSWPSPTLKSEG